MRILICDDDTLIIEQLQKYIESYFESNHLKCPELVSFTSGESLLAEKSEKDIVFLDIEMPGMNGIKILPGSMYNYFSSLCFYCNYL